MMRTLGVRWLATAIALLTLAGCLGGCLGKAPPVEEYLSVRPAGEQPCARPASPGSNRVTVALKPFKAMDALDRQAVLMGQGRIMRPSMAWYWEASPASLVDQALVRVLACSRAAAPVWPMRSTTRADVVLTGMVSAFWVDTGSKLLHAEIRAQLWDDKQVRVLATREFSAQANVASLEAQAVAEAGSKALSQIAAEVAAWLETETKSAKVLPSASEGRIE